MKRDQLIGTTMACAGVLLFSTKAVFVKLAYQHDVDVISLLLLRMGFSLPIFIVVSFFKSNNKSSAKLKFKDWMVITLLGITGYYLSSLFDFLGLERINASLERLILFVYPTFVVLLSRIWLKKEIKRIQIITIVASYIGILVMFLPSLLNTNNSVDMIGVVLIVLSAIAYATYLVGSNYMIKDIGSLKFTNIAMIVSCICVIIHYGSNGDIQKIMHLETPVYFYGFIMAVFATVIPSYLISGAIGKIGAPNLAIIGSIGPVSTIGLAILFLDEKLDIYQIMGGAIILISIIWMNIKK